MTLTKMGGWAGVICAATYIFGFALLVGVLAPLGFGGDGIDPRAVVNFIHEHGFILSLWNNVIYVLNALALVVLVVAIARHLHNARPDGAMVTMAFGLIWAALVLGAGMMANVASETAMDLYAVDPQAAADLWTTLHAVENGLGGGNEIAGGVWIALVGLVGWGVLWRAVSWLGLICGISGLLTVIPALGEVTGAVFGLSAIVWFALVGVNLIRRGA